MNPFSMMMAAAKESAKREIPPPIIQKVVQKGKRGRPPAIKKESVEIKPFPVADSTRVTSLEMTKRRNYETGDGKNDMDKAVNIVIQAKGHHLKRTALIYGVCRKSLDLRYRAHCEDDA